MIQPVLEAPAVLYSSSEYLVTPRSVAIQTPTSKKKKSTLTHAGAECVLAKLPATPRMVTNRGYLLARRLRRKHSEGRIWFSPGPTPPGGLPHNPAGPEADHLIPNRRGTGSRSGPSDTARITGG